MTIEQRISPQYRQVTEFASSGLTTVRFIISGIVEDVPTHFGEFAAIFPTLAGGYDFTAITGTSQREIPKEEKMARLRKLLDLELSIRVESIPKDERIYASTQFIARLAGYPEVVVGWGNRVKDNGEVITLFVLKGASPREEFSKFKDRLRLALSRKRN